MDEINTTPSRYPSRSVSDKSTLYEIVDEGLFCTISFNREGIPHQIPTGFCRVNDDLYIHASAKSHFMASIIGEMVSYSVTLMDALVLAPTAFDHSFNYRSVIGFARAEELTDPEEKRRFFNLFTDRYVPGRIEDVGEPSDDQVAITTIVRLSLSKAAAKVRSGDVNVKMDHDAPWCGIIPLNSSYGIPLIDVQLDQKRPLPDYLKNLISTSNNS